MLFGDSSFGFSYSPDRRKDTVSHYPMHSQFLGASGSKQGGYYYSASQKSSTQKSSGGWYDGAGRYHEG